MKINLSYMQKRVADLLAARDEEVRKILREKAGKAMEEKKKQLNKNKISWLKGEFTQEELASSVAGDDKRNVVEALKKKFHKEDNDIYSVGSRLPTRMVNRHYHFCIPVADKYDEIMDRLVFTDNKDMHKVLDEVRNWTPKV